jgi:leucyl aminopeptidase (aminopeptidase T)
MKVIIGLTVLSVAVASIPSCGLSSEKITSSPTSTPAATATAANSGDAVNTAALARRVVTESAKIKPGDVVVIDGGKHTIPLMEALAIEAQEAGGFVMMFLESDLVIRSYNVDVPEKYLEQKPKFFAEWLKPMDVYISLPAAEDLKSIIAGVPEARFAKAAQAGQVITDMLNGSKVRLVLIGYPSKQEAENNQLDFRTYEKMHWAAVNADYRQIAERGDQLKGLLRAAKQVRVTSPSGTDLSFAVGNRPVVVQGGVVPEQASKEKFFLSRVASLPGGSLSLAPVETSVNGKVAVPKSRCRYEPLNDASFEFKNGKLDNFKAGKGADCFNQTMAPYTGPKDMFASFSIGLNPSLRVIEDGGDYRPYNAAGMVYVGIGDNQLLGGSNKTRSVYNFPIVNATVAIDGKVVVKDGQLIF